MVEVRPLMSINAVIERRASGPTTCTKPGRAVLLSIIGMAKPMRIHAK